MTARDLFLPAALGLLALAIGYAVEVGRKWRGRLGLVQWALALALLSANLLLLHANPVGISIEMASRNPWAIALSNLVFAAGLLLMLESLMQFSQRSLGRLAMVPPAVLALIQSLQIEDAGSRLILSALMGAAIQAASAACALNLPGVPLRLRRLFAGFFALGTAGCLLGIAMNVGIAAPSNAQSLTAWTSLYLSYVGASLCLLLAHRERDDGEAQRFATLDPVTGLYNRRALVQLGQRELARSLRRQRTCSVMIVHIDRLKRINDEFGHEAGDSVLRDLAARMQESAHRHEINARYGSAEFCMILPDTPLDGVEHVAERVRESVAKDSGSSCAAAYTVSIGVAERAPSEFSFEHLVTRADMAQMRARETGRDKVERDEAGSSSRARVRGHQE
ncbi:GGDEF domain-containing protein [Niveibacterium sp. SC-1]|uniref:GGDEF domain-containing protein n=1 Tax=Niveibacterium sp. SC-1 TaxID=3135646 RepID=UPI00311DF000